MARGRKLSPYIEVSGPLFESGLVQDVKDAAWEGMKELGDEGVGIMMGFVEAGGFRRTGEFLRDIEAEEHRDKANAIGWIKLYPPHQWPAADRPTRTWMEEGRRGNRLQGGTRVRLTKGVGAFRKTAQRLNAMKYDQFILPHMLRALNGD